jgi:SAM-dependent methyltransferase
VQAIDRVVHRRFNRHVIHLTPRYVARRLRTIAFHKLHPGRPWLNPAAVRIVERELGPTDVGIEWGSGRSTLWLARTTAFVNSIESDRSWHDRVAADLRRNGVGNARLELVEAVEGDPERLRDYVDALPDLERGSLTYAFVDGIFRESCVLRAVDLLAPGGLLILDNANWWIPHDTDAPFSASTPATPLAGEMVAALADWPLRWTSDGITDTAIWRKPS